MSEGIGHNSAASDQLLLFVTRIERLNEEKKGIADDIKDVFAEVKATGLEPKMVRYVLGMRKLAREERDELLALQQTYLAAAGLA